MDLRLVMCGLVLGALVGRPAPALPLPLPLDAVRPEASDALITRLLGPVVAEEQLQQQGAEVTAYVDQPEGLTLTFLQVEAPRPAVVAMPNGRVYLTRPVLDALKGDPERVAFVLAAGAALVLDGKSRDDGTVYQLVEKAGTGALPEALLAALDKTLVPERVYQADRTAMLCLVRAGLPPLEAVRALDDLARKGVRTLCGAGDPKGVPTVLDRKVRATQAAADLIKAATEFDFGVMDLVEKRYEDAIPRFKAFLEILPRNYAGWNNLGLCEYHLAVAKLPPRQLLLADAIAEFDTSFVTRSMKSLDQEHYDKALAAYRKAAEIDPLRVEALSNLGNLHCVVYDYQKARHYYDLALSQKPGYAPALNNYGVVLAEEITGDFPREALARFQAAATADPTLAEAQFNLGQALAEVGEQGWEEPFRRYIALAPTGPKALFVQRALGQSSSHPTAVAAGESENDLELYNRVKLALETQRRDLVAMVTAQPDQQRSLPNRDVAVLGWSGEGLVVELISNKVNRVLAGRPPGHEAKTGKGVQVGFTLDDLKAQYGAPPAVSKQAPYDIWLYPRTGLGFFVLGEKVNKIFLFQVEP